MRTSRDLDSLNFQVEFTLLDNMQKTLHFKWEPFPHTAAACRPHSCPRAVYAVDCHRRAASHRSCGSSSAPRWRAPESRPTAARRAPGWVHMGRDMDMLQPPRCMRHRLLRLYCCASRAVPWCSLLRDAILTMAIPCYGYTCTARLIPWREVLLDTARG